MFPLRQRPCCPIVLTGILIVQGGAPHHFLIDERTHQEQVLIYDNLQGNKWILIDQIKSKSLAWGFIFRRHNFQPYSFQPEQYKVIAPSTVNEADQSKASKLSKPRKCLLELTLGSTMTYPNPKRILLTHHQSHHLLIIHHKPAQPAHKLSK